MLNLVLQYNDSSGKKISVYKEKPVLSRFFSEILDEQDKSMKRRVRFLHQFFQGSIVYYLQVAEELVAYCVVTKGGGRYTFSTEKDVLLTPYFVKKDYRGNHYSELLISTLLNDVELEYEKVYDWIKKSNIPSLKCSKACGMAVVATADLNNFFFRLIKLLDVKSDDSGKWYLLCANRMSVLKNGG